MSAPKFKVGDVVRPKSGGPQMTVDVIAQEAVHCVWFTQYQDGTWSGPNRFHFSEDALQLVA